MELNLLSPEFTANDCFNRFIKLCNLRKSLKLDMFLFLIGIDGKYNDISPLTLNWLLYGKTNYCLPDTYDETFLIIGE